ncbi:MAG: Trk system potassium transporter TrkA [Thermodesulfobacteriota bacterium]|nr:Trk system potassium transporter TrkA [Thermodesulfobacteriota bacterium]
MKVVIIGAGEVGYNIANRLSNEDQDVVIVDSDEDKVKKVSEELDVQAIHGRGSNPEVLEEAGIAGANLFIAVTNIDEINMISCLMAGMMTGFPLIRIARIREAGYVKYQQVFDKEHLGIDLVIDPEREVVKDILNLMKVPGATRIVDFADGRVKLLGLRVEDGSEIVDKKLKEIGELHPDKKILIASIARGDTVIIPDGDEVIKRGDILFPVTLPELIPNIYRVLGKQLHTTKRVMIIGMRKAAVLLAKELEKMEISAKIIASDAVKCSEMASCLDKTMVLHGDPTDQRLLREEGIENTDIFIALSEDEKMNILTSLLAKRMKAKVSIALVDNVGYIPLVSQIGVDCVVSARQSAVKGILQFIRKGKIISVTPLGDVAEAMEAVAMETSDIVNKPLRNLNFPEGAIIGAIIRKDGIEIPNGDTIVNPGDTIIIFSRRDAIKRVEKKVTVKLEYF